MLFIEFIRVLSLLKTLSPQMATLPADNKSNKEITSTIYRELYNWKNITLSLYKP